MLAEPLVLSVSQQLALIIEEQTKFLELVVNKRCDACKEKRTKWSDLLESTQNLILMASSVDGKRILNKPTTLYREFYTKKVATKAQAFLNETLAAAGCIASVYSGWILALFSGSFLRDVADLPANFSIFLVPVA